ncbi:uncharacterized protein LOC135383505 [Ornithodoros turicata]|uniref:uncharacterized protein LOC135383505 n=1 Tax=Ornithodoros turicata TaxID=34597 RepID=UPI0031388964
MLSSAMAPVSVLQDVFLFAVLISSTVTAYPPSSRHVTQPHQRKALVQGYAQPLNSGSWPSLTTRTIRLMSAKQGAWLPWFFTTRIHDDVHGGIIYNKLDRKKPPVRTETGRSPSAPIRHEPCDTDVDCRRSRTRICVKRAYELHGRCQCPFYRPVEVTIGDRTRCITAKDIFDECRATEECTASNQNLQCINRLCVCSSPYVLRGSNECVLGNVWDTKRVRSVLEAGSVILVIAVVTGAICLVTRKFKKRNQNSESLECSTLQGTSGIVPNEDLRPYPRAPQVPTQKNNLIKKIPRLPNAYDGLRRLYRRSLSFSARSSGITGDPGDTSQHPKSPKKLWLKGGISSMANKLYQNKLVNRLRRRSQQDETDLPSLPQSTLEERTMQQVLPQQTVREQNWPPPGMSQQQIPNQYFYAMQAQSIPQANPMNMPHIMPRTVPQQYPARSGEFPAYSHYGEGAGMQMPQLQRSGQSAPFTRTENIPSFNVGKFSHEEYQRPMEGGAGLRQHVYSTKYNEVDEMDSGVDGIGRLMRS